MIANFARSGGPKVVCIFQLSLPWHWTDIVEASFPVWPWKACLENRELPNSVLTQCEDIFKEQSVM